MDSDKVGELQKCIDRHREVHRNRMSVEYKSFFTILTFYIGATWALLNSHFMERCELIKILIPMGYCLLAILSIWFLRRIHFANGVNKIISENYETELLNILSLQTNPIPEYNRRNINYDRKPRIRFFFHNWGLQSIIILSFATICSVLLYFGVA